MSVTVPDNTTNMTFALREALDAVGLRYVQARWVPSGMFSGYDLDLRFSATRRRTLTAAVVRNGGTTVVGAELRRALLELADQMEEAADEIRQAAL